MNAQLVLNFDNAEDLLRVLQFLKESGLDNLRIKSKKVKKAPTPAKQPWSFGIGNLGGKLDNTNIRDFAHD